MKTADQEQAEISALVKEAALAVADEQTTAANVSALLKRIDVALGFAGQHATAASEHALDPLLDPEQLDLARRVATEMALQSDRLHAVRRRLDAVASIAKNRDKQRELRVAYVAAQALRDKAASRVRAEYPELANKLAALAREIAEADQAVSRVNAPGRLPSGAEALNRVEGHVFGWNDASAGNHPAEVRVCRIAAVVLPDPNATAFDSFPIWPPRLGIGNQSIPKPDIRHVLAAINPQPVRYW